MAMPQIQQNFISTSSYQCKRLLEMYGVLQQLNVLWAGAPNFDSLIDQEAIDSVQSFSDSELTTQVLADAEFALATIMGTITNALPALTHVASLP